MARSLAAASALFTVVLAACGGGGGGGDSAVVPPPAPTFTVGVAYLADAEEDERAELFVADLDGDGALKVSGPLAAGGDVSAFSWSPDRTLLAFVADKDTDDVSELYVVAAAGGLVTKVSGPLPVDADVTDFEWAPDSSRVAYRVAVVDGSTDLFSVSAQGGAGASVSGPRPMGSSGVQEYGWSPSSTRIAYVSDQDQSGLFELFTSPAVGGGSVQVSGNMPVGGQVSRHAFGGLYSRAEAFTWSPDSARIAYLATQDSADALELFVSQAAGGGNVKVNPPLAAEDLVEACVYEFFWTLDSQNLVYAANQFDNHRGVLIVSAIGVLSYGVLFSASFDGVFPIRMVLSANGTRVAGIAAVLGEVSGSAFATELSGPSVGESPNVAVRVAWSPGLSYLGLAAPDAVHCTFPSGLYSVLGAPVVSSLAPGEVLLHDSLAWAPDGSRVAYLTQDLHVSFPASSYGAERITPLLHGTDRRVRKLQWTADSLRLVYAADINAAQMVELFLSPRDAASRIALSQPLVFGGQVLDFDLR